MLQAKPSTIPGRKHKMVHVDFSNPYLRVYMQTYVDAHKRRLGEVAACLEGWVEKSLRLEAAESAEKKSGARPMALVCDIDEVLLSNIHMNSFEAPPGVQGKEAIEFHAADFFGWPRGARLNPLLQGAQGLLTTARALGLEIFLITGRLESIRDETVENLEVVGLTGARTGGHHAEKAGPTDAIFATAALRDPGGPLVMCPDAEYPPPGQSIRPFKESRRKAIEKQYRIVLNIGDQVSDLGLHGDVQVLIPHPFYHIP